MPIATLYILFPSRSVQCYLHKVYTLDLASALTFIIVFLTTVHCLCCTIVARTENQTSYRTPITIPVPVSLRRILLLHTRANNTGSAIGTRRTRRGDEQWLQLNVGFVLWNYTFLITQGVVRSETREDPSCVRT